MPQGDGGKQHGISPQQTHNAPRKPKEMKCEETAMRLAPRCDWRPPNPRWRRNLLRAFLAPRAAGCVLEVIHGVVLEWHSTTQLAAASHPASPCGCCVRSCGAGEPPSLPTLVQIPVPLAAQNGAAAWAGNLTNWGVVEMALGERMAPRIMGHWTMSWCSQ